MAAAWCVGSAAARADRQDNSDIQYRIFRENLPLIAALMVVYAAISWLVAAAGARASQAVRRLLRVGFLAVMSTVFLAALHGTQAPKVVLLALGNYALVHVAERALPPRAVVPLVFAYNCAALIGVFYTDGVPYGKLHPGLAWLDEHSGLLPRWYINFNFSMLRLISFACDYHWAVRAAAADTHGSAARAHGAANRRPDPPPAFAPPETTPDARERTRRPRSVGDYSLVNYLLYVFYPPLFIAGPVITFNDFCAQLQHPLHIGIGTMARYAVRVAACVLVMEFVLHYMYVNAIKNARAWLGDSPMELSMIGFWNLIFVWLKVRRAARDFTDPQLLIPWRVFRLWSLLDGVDAPENMIRCMANNYSALAFWRSWHRSYNLWVVRYIYIPVGGARNLLPAVLLVFTFVALWHDLSFTLLTWAWLVTLFIAPEVLATYLLPARRFGKYAWYRHVCAIGAVGNILMMMTANLVGFVVGTDGVQYIWRELTAGWYGVRFLLVASACLFVGAQVMCVHHFSWWR